MYTKNKLIIANNLPVSEHGRNDVHMTSFWPNTCNSSIAYNQGYYLKTGMNSNADANTEHAKY